MSDTPRETRSQEPDGTQPSSDPGTEERTDAPAADQPTASEDVTTQDRTGAPGSGSSVDPEPTGADADSGTESAASGRGAATGDSGGASTGDSSTGDTTPVVNQPSSADEATQVMPAVDESDSDNRRVTRDELYAREDRQGERERLAAVRAEHEAATAPAEPVPAPAPEAEQPPAQGRRKRLKYPRTTDRFFPSLGLLLLRLTMAVTFGVHGVQKLLTMEQTSEFFGTLTFFGTPLPYPSILALATGVAEVLIAVSLAFGFLVRFASVGILLITIGALLMVRMTTLSNPLEPGASGISGELELVLAGGGALLLCIGGGAWALDRLFRRGRYSKDPQDLMD